MKSNNDEHIEINEIISNLKEKRFENHLEILRKEMQDYLSENYLNYFFSHINKNFSDDIINHIENNPKMKLKIEDCSTPESRDEGKILFKVKNAPASKPLTIITISVGLG